MGFYIIEINDKYKRVVLLSADGELYCKDVAGLMPYTEPDLNQVRKEAYAEGYKEGMQLSIDDAKLKEEYKRGLADAWEACRKIGCYEIDGGYPVGYMLDLFDRDDLPKILSDYTAAEAIEKLKAYEQEQETDGLRQNIQTIVDQCGYSLDEIAAVLEKMREGQEQ